MTLAPHLKTRRLRLVPFAERHLAERYVAWLNDTAVVRYSEQRHTRHTLESCREFWNSFVGTPHYYWAIEEIETGRHVGNIDAHIDTPNKVADVAIIIGEKEIWGKGYGGEAWNCVLEHLFHSLGMRKITAGTMATNQGMLRIMRNSGMVEEGRRHKNHLQDGNEIDLILMGRFADEMWQG